jgi:hypothetical protein
MPDYAQTGMKIPHGDMHRVFPSLIIFRAAGCLNQTMQRL